LVCKTKCVALWVSRSWSIVRRLVGKKPCGSANLPASGSKPISIAKVTRWEKRRTRKNDSASIVEAWTAWTQVPTCDVAFLADKRSQLKLKVKWKSEANKQDEYDLNYEEKTRKTCNNYRQRQEYPSVRWQLSTLSLRASILDTMCLGTCCQVEHMLVKN